MVDIQQDKARMGGIKLKALYRPQIIGNSAEQKVVSLFSDAEEKKEKIGDDSNGEESDADQKFQGQLFNYDFALESGKK